MSDAQTVQFAIYFTEAEAAERHSAHRKYGAWMSPAESRARDAAEALGLTVLPRSGRLRKEPTK